MVIQWFIRVSRVVLSKFVDLLELLQSEYLNEVRIQKQALQALLSTSIQQFSTRTGEIFIKVLTVFYAGYASV